jgi:DNA end-binding protein Ku
MIAAVSARAIASGTISFGLVTIPIKLYATGQSSAGISFNLLHRKCGTRLKQQYTCPKDEEIVERSEMAKGYEFAKDQYVLFSEDELKALEEQASEAIEITEFVPAARIDPVYFEKAYFMGPDKGADKAYRLLKEAMKETGRSALARYSARGKQYLVMLRPTDEGIVMQQLRYADEVRTFAEVPLGTPSEVKAPELKLAVQLIEQIASDEFHPENYEDAVKKRTQELIDRKVQGEQITAAPAPAPKGQIIDLMEALKASLAQAPRATKQDDAETEDRKPPKRSPRDEATEKPASKRRKGGSQS